ncbi:hypothetical protein PTQ33_00700 [Campylobacter sp. 50012-21]|nr:hypothetical protein [Campylobacter magnus]MDD0845646.1 hypothetical protein [Campylobacter magnus]
MAICYSTPIVRVFGLARLGMNYLFYPCVIPAQKHTHYAHSKNR